MRAVIFTASFICFLVYLWNTRGEEKRRKTSQTARAASLENAQEARERRKPSREEETYNFYRDRVLTLSAMLEEATREEERRQAEVDHIRDLNQYGQVIPIKTEERASKLLYQAQRKTLAIASQLEQARKGKQKAINTLTGN